MSQASQASQARGEAGRPEAAGWTPIPVSVITGFLGAGKTTLLSRLLRHPGMAETAVIINEFGEIGLDHRLVEAVDAETLVMTSGCLCCTIRSDLADTLRELYLKRVRGAVPAFRRVVIETTGLADPAPILHTLMDDPILEAYYRLDGVVATVDAVNADWQLDSQFESVKQAAVADRIVLTKTDIAEEEAVAGLKRRLEALNPGAPILVAVHGAVDPERLFDAGLYDPKTKTMDVQRWLNAEAFARADDRDHGHDRDRDNGSKLDVNRHDERIRAHCLVIGEPIEWEPFTQWLGAFARHRGEDLLRLKGILNVAGEDKPIAIHGIQHLFHPPARLPHWPDADRRSRLVFITRDIAPGPLERSLGAYRDPASRDAWRREG
ncbi:MAG: CobW family GTP-binding protein [Pseudomonadota bacterium]